MLLRFLALATRRYQVDTARCPETSHACGNPSRRRNAWWEQYFGPSNARKLASVPRRPGHEGIGPNNQHGVRQQMLLCGDVRFQVLGDGLDTVALRRHKTEDS